MELADIQGIVFSGFQAKPFATYLLLQVVDAAAARKWLGVMASTVTTGAHRHGDCCITLALSSAALQTVGLDANAYETFPLEFREGMAGSETRSRTLGDVGTSEPSRWAWGRPESRVHVFLALFARTRELLDELVLAQKKGFEGALACVFEHDTETLPERREHFGFADGIAQPVIAGSGRRASNGEAAIAAGEFVLGYPNEYGKLPFIPHVAAALDVGGHLEAYADAGEGRKAFGKNGSFVVVRQLEQHVFEFWRYLRAAAEKLHPGSTPADGAIRLGAKCVGRWPSGAPLVEAPDGDVKALGQNNDFGYFANDAQGMRCPVGAHIRRTNPRDSLEPDPSMSKTVVNRHRIMRRGRSYGDPVEKPWLAKEDDGRERGLFFICVNSNIRRQFEFIQQTWVNNAKFAGLYDERDPLIGAHDDEPVAFSIPCEPARERLEGMPRFVDVRGGDYFFLPSVRALKFLGSLPGR
jgi:Dyp-type peroxidase family